MPRSGLVTRRVTSATPVRRSADILGCTTRSREPQPTPHANAGLLLPFNGAIAETLHINLAILCYSGASRVNRLHNQHEVQDQYERRATKRARSRHHPVSKTSHDGRSRREQQNVAAPATGAQYLVATLERQGAGAGWTATVGAQHAQIVVVPPHDLAIAANKSTQMWLISQGAKPVSLGVIDTLRPTVVHLAPEQLQGLGPQTTLAVSLEPHGGSPTGQPTGPVLAAGHPAAI